MKKVKKSSIRFTHMSFPVRTCIGVLPGRELESAEAATLSFAFREDLLEEATCLDKWSFFVMVGVEWQRGSSEGGVRRWGGEYAQSSDLWRLQYHTYETNGLLDSLWQ